MRLTASSAFALVREGGRVQRGRFMRVAVLPAPLESEQRFGIVISRHVGGAVVRNRFRRRLKEICRMHRNLIDTGWWIVTTAKPLASQATFAELRDEWLRLIGRLSIFRASQP